MRLRQAVMNAIAATEMPVEVYGLSSRELGQLKANDAVGVEELLIYETERSRRPFWKIAWVGGEPAHKRARIYTPFQTAIVDETTFGPEDAVSKAFELIFAERMDAFRNR